MSIIPLMFTEDNIGRIGEFGMRNPNFVDFINLPANVGVTLTVPDNANHVLFSLSADFFVKYDSDGLTSAVYTDSSVGVSGVCNGNAAELNPWLRTLVSVTGLSLISPDNASVTLSWYA